MICWLQGKNGSREESCLPLGSLKRERGAARETIHPSEVCPRDLPPPTRPHLPAAPWDALLSSSPRTKAPSECPFAEHVSLLRDISDSNITVSFGNDHYFYIARYMDGGKKGEWWKIKPIGFSLLCGSCVLNWQSSHRWYRDSTF